MTSQIKEKAPIVIAGLVVMAAVFFVLYLAASKCEFEPGVDNKPNEDVSQIFDKTFT